MKEGHTSFVNDQFRIFNTLKEKVVVVEFDYCSSLKIEIDNLKGQLTYLYKSPSITYISQSDKGQSFRKPNKKNDYFTRKNRNNISPRMICHYCCVKCHRRY